MCVHLPQMPLGRNRLGLIECTMTLVADRSALVTTADAAKAVGISRATLQRWANAGIVEPEWRTAGGHMRWDLDSLREQARTAYERERDRRERGEDEP